VHVDAVYAREVEGRGGCVVGVLRVSYVGLLSGGIVRAWIEIAVSECIDGGVGVLCLSDLEDGTAANSVRTCRQIGNLQTQMSAGSTYLG
jgi:hypothetical protein